MLRSGGAHASLHAAAFSSAACLPTVLDLSISEAPRLQTLFQNLQLSRHAAASSSAACFSIAFLTSSLRLSINAFFASVRSWRLFSEPFLLHLRRSRFSAISALRACTDQNTTVSLQSAIDFLLEALGVKRNGKSDTVNARSNITVSLQSAMDLLLLQTFC
jgi:hypothetical protein